MYRSSHSEEEHIGDFVLLTLVLQWECSNCGVKLITWIPGLQPEQLEKH